MRVCVVGAGMAGLAAARTLCRAGHQAVVFEASLRVGGRVATERLGPYVFDSGATTIAPRGRALEEVMLRELASEDLALVSRPVFVHTGLRVSPGNPVKNRIERYSYRSGNETLPNALAAETDVRLGAPVEEVSVQSSGTVVCMGEEFDAVVITPPAPIARGLLSGLGETRPLANASYRPCLSVLLGYSEALDEPSYHALLDPEQRHPLTWLSLESWKCEGRAPEGHTAMVAQLSADYSRRHFEDSDEAIVRTTVDYIERLYGGHWGAPEVFRVVRWVHSLPESTAMFETVNNGQSRVVVAGDSVMGARVEYAYQSGVRAAELVLAGDGERTDGSSPQLNPRRSTL